MPVSSRAEEAPGGQISVGEVRQKGDAGLSLAWGENRLIVYIALPAES